MRYVKPRMRRHYARPGSMDGAGQKIQKMAAMTAIQNRTIATAAFLLMAVTQRFCLGAKLRNQFRRS
ncbi:hypothetical protein [Sphingomonas sanxanigenens]|nr:hypothetical protein [Sphingomonas sanxanigenens]